MRAAVIGAGSWVRLRPVPSPGRPEGGSRAVGGKSRENLSVPGRTENTCLGPFSRNPPCRRSTFRSRGGSGSYVFVVSSVAPQVAAATPWKPTPLGSPRGCTWWPKGVHTSRWLYGMAVKLGGKSPSAPDRSPHAPPAPPGIPLIASGLPGAGKAPGTPGRRRSKNGPPASPGSSGAARPRGPSDRGPPPA